MLDSLETISRVAVYYPHNRMCDQEDCLIVLEDHPLYGDDDHLSVYGAEFLYPEVLDALRRLQSSEKSVKGVSAEASVGRQ